MKQKFTAAIKFIRLTALRACVIFTVFVLIINSLADMMSVDSSFEVAKLFSTFLFALILGACMFVFDLQTLPVFSRHILFFILFFADFIFFYAPRVLTNLNPRSTLMLSIAFIVVYAISFAVYAGLKVIFMKFKEKE